MRISDWSSDVCSSDLHALVLESRTAQHGLDFTSNGARTQTQVDLGLGELACFQVFVHELFVSFSGGFNQLFVPLVSLVDQVGRDIDVFELSTLAGFVPDDAIQDRKSKRLNSSH